MATLFFQSNQAVQPQNLTGTLIMAFETHSNTFQKNWSCVQLTDAIRVNGLENETNFGVLSMIIPKTDQSK